MVTFARITPEDPLVPALAALRAEARAEGYRFVDTLAEDWETGHNRFDRPGELLLAAWDGGMMIAVGGLNRDPYPCASGTGRLRHVFVAAARRRSGMGGALVRRLMDGAHDHFDRVRLRTASAKAGLFYECLGFVRTNEDHATHVWPGR